MLFSIVLLISGVAIFLYLAGAVVEMITRGVVQDVFGERRRKRQIDDLQDHTIICGFGRVGRRVAAEFNLTGRDFVVLDSNQESVAAAVEHGALVVHGDGTEDAGLEAAGLAHARALIACADSDENNLYITLSARAARPDLFIIARASDASAARKLRLAGADRVVEPYSSAGLQIANLVLKPQVADYLDIVATAGGHELRFEEIDVTTECSSCGKSIRDLRVRDATGAMIIAIRKAGRPVRHDAVARRCSRRGRAHRRRHPGRDPAARGPLRSGATVELIGAAARRRALRARRRARPARAAVRPVPRGLRDERRAAARRAGEAPAA
jgi:voltage-gated potassium channel